MLKGLVSLVTGGAAGLGRATAQHLAKHGGCVVLADLPDSDGQKTAEQLEGDVTFVPCDVASEADVAKAVAVCQAKFGRLDVAVSCASQSRAFKIANPVRGNIFQLSEFSRTFESNLYGTFNVVRLGAQLMARNEPRSGDGQRGVIINTGCMSADDGTVGQSAYAASKGAIVAMTLPISRELASLGIRVVTISPGFFDTMLMSEVCLSSPIRAYYEEQTQFPRRFGKPSEFAQMVETVIENPMLNGVNIKLTAGVRLHVHTPFPEEESLHHPSRQNVSKV